jgi:formyl-CoA transferase
MTNSRDQLVTHAPGALAGIRVIEIGTFISGPFASALLGDFGAEVIKIELPGVGDQMRALGTKPATSDSSYWWSMMGRNKRSVGLDVRTPEGREVLGRLVADADVFIENFRPGTLEKWGIGPEWLQQKRPGIIVLRISGYGQDGPLRGLPGFDRNAQAFSGLVYVTGDPGGPPQQAGLPISDYSAGLWGAFGVLAALVGRLLQGDDQGNEIDLALYEATLPFLKDMPATYAREGNITERTGNTPDYVAPGGTYLTKDDDWVFISGTGDRVFARLMAAIGRDDLASLPQHRDNRDRVINRTCLDEAINAWTRARSTRDVIDSLEAFDVPVAKINHIGDVMDHPQVVARKNFVWLADEHVGNVPLAAPIPRMAHHGPSIRWLGEQLGESTRDILAGDLGLTESELQELETSGVISPQCLAPGSNDIETA